MQKQLITFLGGRLSILIEISEQTKTALGEGPSKGARISMRGRKCVNAILALIPGAAKGNSDGGVAADP